jgi:hypothetical protein
VAGVEGLLQEGEHKAAAVCVRKEGGAGEADSVVGAAGMGVAGGLCPVLKVVRDLDAVIVLEPGESLKKHRNYVNFPRLFVVFVVILTQCCGSGSGIQSLFDPGIRIRDEQPGSYFRELRNNFFGLKILKFFDADPGCKTF